VIFGLGIIVGSMIAAIIQEWATATVGAEHVIDYTKLFGVPMWASLLTLVAFWFLYPGKKMQDSK
jgi:dipeptide/tripeptide permease